MEKFFQENTKFTIEEHIGGSLATDRHFHALYEFYYLCQGEIAYFIDDKIYTVKKGDVIIIPPNTIHKSITLKNPKRKRILFYLDKEFLQEFPPAVDLLQTEAAIFQIGTQLRLQSIFTELLTEFNEEDNPLMLKALICELLILLNRQKTVSVLSESNVTSNRILDVVAYINEAYASELTLTAVANRFFMNPSYLSRLFKENTGFTFSEYLNKYRIKKAVELLISTKKNVTEIAFATGFNSSNHFCKTFKSIMGASPLGYRKTHRA
ncbi:MAG: helix-turn-helix domain-containing protein [Clostridia bacterium]|nr:helix-turn-helix domain-containing protein [Clostridia bacterium]